MPVIGRLDGQVEEVIINPVGRRAPDASDAPDNAPPPRATPRESPTEERPDEHSGERRDDGELPVWLL